MEQKVTLQQKKIYLIFLLLALLLEVLGLILDQPINILLGLHEIIRSESGLITDYMALAGPGQR